MERKREREREKPGQKTSTSKKKNTQKGVPCMCGVGGGQGGAGVEGAATANNAAICGEAESKLVRPTGLLNLLEVKANSALNT